MLGIDHIEIEYKQEFNIELQQIYVVKKQSKFTDTLQNILYNVMLEITYGTYHSNQQVKGIEKFKKHA